MSTRPVFGVGTGRISDIFTSAPNRNREAAMISIAQKLRAARERSGLTQEALAAAAGGVSQAQISLYERGLLRPEDEVAERILRAAKPRPRAVLGHNAERIATIGRRHS